MKLLNTTKKLINIKKNLDLEAGVDISTKCRERPIVLYRVLFFKLALELTDEPLDKIGKILKRDHSTVVHSRNNTFEYMMSLQKYRNLYKKYMKIYETPVIDLAEEENAEIKELRKELDVQRDNVAELERIVNAMSGGLTKNEKEYRTLTVEQQIDYDERAGLFLKSLKWKKQNQTGEVINCGNNVVDARGIL